MVRNQRGITAVELLAALAIISFFGVIIWNVFFQGYDYSQQAATKNILQQEANLVITRLTKIHQTSTQYNISDSNCGITVNYTGQDQTPHTEVFSRTGLCYSTDVTGTIDPSQQDVTIKITVYAQSDPTNKVDVDTFLYRLN